MLVTFPPKEILVPTEQDRQFLQELDAKLGTYSKGECDVHGKWTHRNSTSESATPEEMARLLSLFDLDNGLALRPSADVYGYDYFVYHTMPKPNANNVYGKKERLLGISPGQLPKGFDFNRMAEVFMRQSNIDKLVGAEFEAPVHDESRYSY